MRIPGLKTLNRHARWVRSRFVNGALILGYHRVIETDQDPFLISVSPRHFAEQLEVLHRYAHPLSLKEVLQGLSDGRFPKRAVAVTFDDGYSNALYTVKPILEKYQIPATFFIVSGYLGKEFWWDELQRIFLSQETLPDKLRLTVNGILWEWDLDAKANAKGIRLLIELASLIRPLPESKRQEILMQVREWAGQRFKGQATHRVLTAAEIVELANGDLVEVGAHSKTHPQLAKLPLTVQQDEIQTSQAHLEEILGRPIRGFSYPNGSTSVETLNIVQEIGFEYACSSFNDILWRKSNPFNIPRFWIPDWDGESFSYWLKHWLTN